jgi:hypothetical protein
MVILNWLANESKSPAHDILRINFDILNCFVLLLFFFPKTPKIIIYLNAIDARVKVKKVLKAKKVFKIFPHSLLDNAVTI